MKTDDLLSNLRSLWSRVPESDRPTVVAAIDAIESARGAAAYVESDMTALRRAGADLPRPA